MLGGNPNIFIRSPCKISEPYDNPSWENEQRTPKKERKKEIEREEKKKKPLRVATTFCLRTPKGSARTPLGPKVYYEV